MSSSVAMSSGGSTSTTMQGLGGPSSSGKQAQQQQQQKLLPSYLSHLNYDPSLHPFPSGWNAKDKCSLIELSRHQLRIHYTGTGKNDGDAAAVRANCPIPSQCGIFYYEVTVISKGRDGYIGIGFCAQSVSLIRLPGWEPNSYGFHGDDGHSFACSGTGKPYGPTFTTGDIIGCCINFVNNTCFYTKNGVHLGTAFKKLSGQFYPCVGLRTPGEVVEANFGQRPFFFDIEHYVMNEKATLYSQVNESKSKGPPALSGGYQCLNALVMSYLVHHGYTESALAFSKGASTAAAAGLASTINEQKSGNVEMQNGEAKKPIISYNTLSADAKLATEQAMTLCTSPKLLASELAGIQDRQHVRKLILQGDMLGAMQATQSRYPSVLPDNPSVMFALQVRHFIELVLRYQQGQAAVGEPMDADEETAAPESSVTTRRQTRASRAAASVAATSTPSKSAATDWLEEVMRFGQTLQDQYHRMDDPSYTTQLEEAFSLLAYADPFTSPVAHLLDENGREPVANAVNSAILVYQKKPPIPAIERLFRQSCVALQELGQQGIGASAMIHPHRDLLDRTAASRRGTMTAVTSTAANATKTP